MNLKFSDVINEYLEFVLLKNKPQSYRSIKSRINNYILPYFKDNKIDELKPIDYLNWQKKIENLGFKYRYKKTLHYTMVSLLNYCKTFYGLNNNIASNVGNFKNNYELETEINFWTYDEFKQFIDKVDDIVYKTFYEFLYFTGCRQGEALALTFNDINNNIVNINKTISKEYYNGKRIITTPKTKKSVRKIIIDDNLKCSIDKLKKHYLNKYNELNNNNFIFGYNSALAPTTIERKKDKYCKIANVKQIRIHDFRHSHATLLLSNNVPIIAISKRLGHTNTSITLDVYSHLIPEDEKRVISTLNKIRLN